MTKYTPQYFIDLFSAIPDDQWCVGQARDKQGRQCAMSHCPPYAYKDLGKLLDWRTAGINDAPSTRYPQSTPKERVLAALREIDRP